MKLLRRTSYYYLIITVPVCLLGGLIFYFYISKLLNEEIDEQLEIQKKQLLEFVSQQGHFPEISTYETNSVQFKAALSGASYGFRDTLLLSPLKDEHLQYRQLSFPASVSGQVYTVTIFRPLVEKDDLLETIGKSLAIFLLLLLLALFTLTHFLSRRLWTPFYKTISKFNHTDLNSFQSSDWPPTVVTEFRELQAGGKRMLDKIHDQYKNLKQFTDHASHEIQTHLAVARTKMELLIQNGNYSEAEWKLLHDTFNSITRLSKLTQSLLLISKIDNQQFQQKNKINLHQLIISELAAFEELQTHRQLKVDMHFDSDLMLDMDGHLAQVLISNLLSNAFKHNQEGGDIKIELDQKKLIVANTGNPPTQPVDSFFQPFVKEIATTESPGLGLAIVDRICRFYRFSCDYQYTNGWHRITIQFS